MRRRRISVRIRIISRRAGAGSQLIAATLDCIGLRFRVDLSMQQLTVNADVMPQRPCCVFRSSMRISPSECWRKMM